MKLVTKLLATAGVALAMMGSAQANTVLNNWGFNPTGTGYAGAQTINEYLDVNGNAFINLQITGANTFNFVEHAVFNISQADSNGAIFSDTFPGQRITATFTANGSGTFNGGFTFSGGTIKMYTRNGPTSLYASANGIYGADLGDQIAEFDVLAGGGGQVDADGIPTNNGQISVFAKATTPGGLDAGYFFRNGGADLAFEDILSFAFTNANTVGSPTALLVDEVACQFAGFGGPGCDGVNPYANVPGDYFFVSNNGQFKLANVPEPGSLALFGIALLGAGVVSRKRAAKKA